MRVAIGQTEGSPSKEQNLGVIAGMVQRAAEGGASLVAFPEYAMFKQPVRDTLFLDEAESLDGPFADAIRALARDNAIAVVIGMQEAIAEENGRTTRSCLVGDDGNDIGAYRKIHLYDAFGGSESTWIRPGELTQDLVFDIGEFRVGTMTCYDLRFPEMARHIVDAGAEVLLIPSAWTPGPRKEDHWSTMVRSRAIENIATGWRLGWRRRSQRVGASSSIRWASSWPRPESNPRWCSPTSHGNAWTMCDERIPLWGIGGSTP